MCGHLYFTVLYQYTTHNVTGRAFPSGIRAISCCRATQYDLKCVHLIWSVVMILVEDYRIVGLI